MKHCPNCQIDADWNTADCPVCLGSLIEDYDKAAHDAAWEKNFVTPIGREMKKRGIAYIVMILRDDGKLAYVLDKEIPENDLAHPRATDKANEK